MSGKLLHLMRHGPPEIPGLLLGRTDSAPTEEGIAACLAQTADLAIGAIVSSDLRRAAEPARAIGEQRGLTVHTDPRWRELDFGDWDGLRPAEIDPSASARFWDDPEAYPPPGGEKWSALVARVTAAIAEIDRTDTLIVTHGGAIRAALAAFCGFGQRQLWSFDLPYGALLTLKVWPVTPPSAQIVGLWP